MEEMVLLFGKGTPGAVQVVAEISSLDGEDVPKQ
jgi:hypothetical protein